MKTIQEKFSGKFIKAKRCWVWYGNKDGRGYGLVTHNNIRWLAHRISWMVHKGNIPRGICVLHRCDNPSCVNPEHLFLGTLAANNADTVAKGRQCRGEKNGMSKLKERTIKKIFHWRTAGFTQQEIADRVQCNQQEISRILIGKRWKHACPKQKRATGIGNKKLPEESISKITAFRESGFSQQKIADLLGVTQCRISQIIRAAKH